MPHPPLTIRLRHSPAFAARAHGWCYLAPFDIDGDSLDWAVRLPKGGARRVTIRWSDSSDAVRVVVPGRSCGGDNCRQAVIAASVYAVAACLTLPRESPLMVCPALAVLRMLARLPWLLRSHSPRLSPPPGNHGGFCWQQQGARVLWLCTPLRTGSPGAATSERCCAPCRAARIYADHPPAHQGLLLGFPAPPSQACPDRCGGAGR